MALPSVFSKDICFDIITRINKLNNNATSQWGKMNVAQMLAHCNITYEMIFDNIHKVPNWFMKFILKLFVKNKVVDEKPYPKNNPTAPAFIIKGDKNFDTEKARLIEFITKVQAMGVVAFEGKESHSFGILTSTEWNNMMYKHLDHHLKQFGV